MGGLDRKAMAFVVAALRSNKSLRSLTLDNSSSGALSGDVLPTLGAALECNAALEALYLRSCNIKEKEAVELLNSPSPDIALKHLYLEGNGLGSKEKAIAATRRFPSLKVHF